jgi:hypothetical protein
VGLAVIAELRRHRLGPAGKLAAIAGTAVSAA